MLKQEALYRFAKGQLGIEALQRRLQKYNSTRRPGQRKRQVAGRMVNNMQNVIRQYRRDESSRAAREDAQLARRCQQWCTTRDSGEAPGGRLALEAPATRAEPEKGGETTMTREEIDEAVKKINGLPQAVLDALYTINIDDDGRVTVQGDYSPKIGRLCPGLSIDERSGFLIGEIEGLNAVFVMPCSKNLRRTEVE